MRWAKWLVAHFGYPGVFFALVIDGLGIPFPGQTLLAFTGFLASRGVLSLWPLLAAGIAGGFVGTLTAFLLVRHWGDAWLKIVARRVPQLGAGARQMRELADSYGLWVLLIGRFLPGVGNTAPYFVAMGGTSFWAFAGVDLIGVGLWAGAPIIAGYLLGEEWEVVGRWVGPIGRWLLIGAVALGVGWLVYTRWVKRARV